MRRNEALGLNKSKSEKDIVVNDVVIAQIKKPVEVEEEVKEIESPKTGEETFASDTDFHINESKLRKMIASEVRHALKEAAKRRVREARPAAERTLWDDVYDTLCADTAAQDLKKLEIKAPKKAKYDSDNMAVDSESNIIVFAATKDELNFAKRVADHYNLETVEREYKRTSNPAHAWSLKLKVAQ